MIALREGVGKERVTGSGGAREQDDVARVLFLLLGRDGVAVGEGCSFRDEEEEGEGEGRGDGDVASCLLPERVSEGRVGASASR